MSKYLDIIPPQKPTSSQPKEAKQTINKRSGNKISWILFFVLLAGAYLFITNSQIDQTLLRNNDVSATQKETSPISKFDLLEKEATNSNNQTEQNIKSQSQQRKIRIINASSKEENLSLATKLLLKQNFDIEQTSTVENKFNQTNIYYKKGSQELAEQAKTALSSSFKTSTEVSLALSDNFDLLLIIGEN